jgi:retron-type reverse transcriptase
MKYIAKPSLFNNKGLKEFDNAKSAIMYLNEILSDSGVDESLDYVFIAPKVSDKKIKQSIEEYTGIGKLILQE